MAESHVVSGLVEKRSEIAGLIEFHRKEIGRLAGQMAHLDATLKLFASEIDLRTLRVKRHRTRNSYFRPGEGQRLLLDVLRVAGEALPAHRIGNAMATKIGLALDTADAEETFLKTVRGIARRAEKAGLVVPVGGATDSWLMHWRLA